MLRTLLTAVLLVMLCVPATLAGEVRIVATTFPLWLITRNVAQDVPGLRVDLLIPAHLGCPHHYALTPQDRLRLAEADLLILNGLGLDDFVPRALQDVPKGAGPHLVESSSGISGIIPGNPHLFTSPSLSAQLAEQVGAALARRDPAHAERYAHNVRSYARRMLDLAEDFAALGAGRPSPRILAQSDLLEYLARDAGLTVSGIIQAHEDQPPAASKLLTLRKQVEGGGVAAVLMDRHSPEPVGRMLAEAGKIPLVALDLADSGPANAPPDYCFRVMRRNLAVLGGILAPR